MSTRVRVLHPITRLIIGGPKDPMLTAQLLDKTQWDVVIIRGPQTGVRSSFMELMQEQGIRLTLEPTLVRELNPIKDLLAVFRLMRFMKQGGYTIVHTHSSKAALWAGGPPNWPASRLSSTRCMAGRIMIANTHC